MLENLPPEILQQILLNKSLDFRDLMNAASTCSYLRNFVVKNQAFWKTKYIRTWPKIHEVAGYVHDYCAETRHGYQVQTSVREILVDLIAGCSRKQLCDEDFKPISDLVAARHLNREYVTEYLRETISDETQVDNGNIPLKYYSLTALRFLSQVSLTAEWNRFFSLLDEDQILERAATMFVQWCRPQDGVTTEDVSRKLDAITGEVIGYLKEEHPGHPLFKIDGNVLREWREKNGFKNQFSARDCRKILSAMWHTMDFSRDEDVYRQIDNSFVTEALESKRGVLVTLAVIYEGVARRLGVNLEPIVTPTRFLLRYTDDGPWTKKVFYIDEFQNGRMFTSNPRFYNRKLTFSRATTKQVIERMANNIKVELPGHTVVGELNRTLQAYDKKTTDYLTSFKMKRRGLWRIRR